MTGWGRFSSDDLLGWQWDGVVLPADASGYAYSGSLAAGDDGALLAWHTRHRPAAGGADPRERQFCAISRDAGASWQAASGPVGPAGHDARDPFLFRHAGAAHMLVARPCGWHDPDGQSRLELARQLPDGDWGPAAVVDVAIPPGVLCEVPSLIRSGSASCSASCSDCALIASFVDRRGPATRSWSGYWPGRLVGGRFTPASAQPIPLDHGPDLYAPIANLAAGWPAAPILIGWASGWATARRLALAGGGHGGAISLPRLFVLAGGRIHQAPLPAAAGLARPLAWQRRGRLRIVSECATAVIDLAPGQIAMVRDGGAGSAWNWAATAADARIGGRASLLFDAGLVELFMAGATATMMVPGTTHRLEWTGDDG